MDILKTLHKYESRSMHGQLPVVWKKAEGHHIWDINGKKYIDFTSGVGVACAGHNNPRINRAIRKAPLFYTYTFPTEIRAKYIKELCKSTGFDKAFLVSSGTQAVEAACRLMRLYGLNKSKNRNLICSFKGAVHGKTALSQRLKWEDYKWTCINDGVRLLSEGEFPLKDSKKICGLLIETYEGWSAKFHDKKYISELVKWAKREDIVVCFDEVQAGFGRTGKMFGFQHYNISRPDLICIGKGISCGVPMSGVLGRRDILDIPEPGSMTSSHSANPLACTAGYENLFEIRRILPTVGGKSKILFDLMKAEPFSRYTINGEGLVAAIMTPTVDLASKVCFKAMNKGLLVIKTDRDSIKIMPPLVISEKDLRIGVRILAESIVEAENEWRS
jgi:4-aminobutyrate aminotransferase-like enzyme